MLPKVYNIGDDCCVYFVLALHSHCACAATYCRCSIWLIGKIVTREMMIYLWSSMQIIGTNLIC